MDANLLDPEDPEAPEDEGELEDNEVLYSDMINTVCSAFVYRL